MITSSTIRIFRKGSDQPPVSVSVARGKTLRQALLESGHSPYRGKFIQLNCRGMGICGSCQVQVREKGALWARRSCQIRCFQDLEIEIE